ncbi:condensin complex subunit 2 isoform X2 [Pararge aegeria]|uniref:condensin complex subunit 2 isoform X2 n=1 Tax=Pararge aegeria TaxID=116150 RepID=UPI0019CFFBF7|nr:condensin complex subunit 2 isoform X2 [Pararge aegeria]
MMGENLITSTPNTLPRLSIGGSSAIRRRSLIPRVANIRNECNDDDAERSLLLASERAVASSTPVSSSPRRGRDTMSSSPQKEHYQGCLKLYAENKITKDNAWNLQLIDFMTSMLRRHDARMENFQTASTVLDATARIYSFRVDAVHWDVLKMAGGLSKAAQTKRGKKDDDNVQDEAPAEGEAAVTKKKKKRSKGAIASNPEVLNGDFDANDCVDPFFERVAATAGDITSSNRAFNATLPIHDKTFALILRTDDQFLEPIKENIPEGLSLNERITIPIKLLPAFNASDQICEPFAGFSISNWDPETEDTNRITNWVEENNRLNLSQQALAFDAIADVEPIPQDEAHNDLYDDEPLGGIESEEEADVALAACVARLPATQLARLTDMRPSAPGHSRLEYSYCAAIVTAWAGPSHWRLKNNRASKMTERTQSTAAGRLTVDGKKPARTKKQLDFMGAGLAFDARSNNVPDYEPAQPAKIMISRKTLATGHTWNEANYKTPIDRGLDESHFRKLFLRRNVVMSRERDEQPTKNTEPLTVEESKEYDYNNENDASYCPNHVSDADDWCNEEGLAAGELHDQAKSAELEEIGDMLEPPTKVAKIFIPYAMRAKKVDMKLLKHCTWRMLTEKTADGHKEDVAPTTFSAIYSRLPEKLSTNMRESLSVPLALLSVLHLANEKGLILEKRDDLKDFDVVGLIKT